MLIMSGLEDVSQNSVAHKTEKAFNPISDLIQHQTVKGGNFLN